VSVLASICLDSFVGWFFFGSAWFVLVAALLVVFLVAEYLSQFGLLLVWLSGCPL